MKITRDTLYSRQTVLEDFGKEGQERLLSSRVAVIGCGGLGNFVAVQLAASGVGHLHLVDYDRVSESNLHRQVFFGTAHVGKLKAEMLARHIGQISPFVKTSLSLEPITKRNISQQLADFDLIVDCTDSLPTKYLLNDFCVLADKTMVYGSLYKHDGYVSSFNLPEVDGRSANLRDAFAHPPEKGIPNCSEVGTPNPIVGLIGSLQSNEVIKILTGSGVSLANKMLIYNSMRNKQFQMSLSNTFDKSKIENLFQSESYFDARCAEQDPELLISPEDLKNRLGEVTILSVIENTDLSIPFEAGYRIPYTKFNIEEFNPNASQDLVVVCNKGITSYEITQRIKSAYPQLNVLSLEGGIEKF
jgi:adenylyltransferase/sulfurtransferase